MIQELISIRINRRIETITKKRKETSMTTDIEVISKTMLISLISIELVKCGEVSSQIDFGRGGVHNEVRKDNRVVEMYPEWKSKKTSPNRFQNTHEDIFVHMEARYNPLRASKLKLEERRDRPFNIISGLDQAII